MKSTVEIFSENLRNQLFSKRKTQAQLAKYLNVTEATVSRWVNGVSLPRSEMIDRICAYLMCSTDALMIDHTQQAVMLPEDVLAEELHENPRLFRLMYYASRLSDDELDALIKIAGAKK